MLKKLLLSVYQRQVDTSGISVTGCKVKSYKEVYEEGFLAMETGSKFGNRSFVLDFTADLLEQKLLTTYVICLCLCPLCKRRQMK